MKIGIILGTRPEIIKMAGIITLCENEGLDYFVLHTGQHYSYNMDRAIYQDLKLPDPRYNLKIGSSTHAQNTAAILEKAELVLQKEMPDIVLVEGDTNTVLAGALAASKLKIKVGHVEAGLRSDDPNMPEEMNRILTDHISHLLFCPTALARERLIKEKVDPGRIYLTGNTIVDAVNRNIGFALKKSRILQRLKLGKKKYFLITAHRQENVDNKKTLSSILASLETLYNRYNWPVIYPVHPRTDKMIRKFKIRIPSAIKVIDPVNYFDFLNLEASAGAILTDSGGIQEEACILKVPCITLRENTERPETLKEGSNILAGTDPERILRSVEVMLGRKANWDNPFGDGKTGENILKIIQDQFISS